MRRRLNLDEPENNERWMVSYADFVTLLFAFFVVMYSVSSVNEGKFRVLADSMVATFKDPKRSLEPVQIGELARAPYTDDKSFRTSPIVVVDVQHLMTYDENDAAAQDEDGGADEAPAKEAVQAPVAESDEAAKPETVPMSNVDDVATQVESEMGNLIDNELVSVRRMDQWVEVEFNSSILFQSGAARLSGSAVDLLSQVAGILKTIPNPIQVEGFTDNVPIRTAAFPSNWELSAARAASVVHLFMKSGVAPGRMVAIGYGEYRPVADNATREGKRKNRRVVLVIPAKDDTRRIVDLERMSSPSG